MYRLRGELGRLRAAIESYIPKQKDVPNRQALIGTIDNILYQLTSVSSVDKIPKYIMESLCEVFECSKEEMDRKIYDNSDYQHERLLRDIANGNIRVGRYDGYDCIDSNRLTEEDFEKIGHYRDEICFLTKKNEIGNKKEIFGCMKKTYMR